MALQRTPKKRRTRAIAEPGTRGSQGVAQRPPGIFGGFQPNPSRGPQDLTQRPVAQPLRTPATPIRPVINEPGGIGTPTERATPPTPTINQQFQDAVFGGNIAGGGSAFGNFNVGQQFSAPAAPGPQAGAAAPNTAGAFGTPVPVSSAFPQAGGLNAFGASPGFGGRFNATGSGAQGPSPISPLSDRVDRPGAGQPFSSQFTGGSFDQRNFPKPADIRAANKGVPRGERIKGSAAQRQQALGEAGFLVDPTQEFNKNLVPFLEFGLNFSERLQADRERAQAAAIINNVLGLVGQSPEQSLAREVATERLENPEFFNQEALDVLTGRVKQGSALGLEGALAEAAGAQARQGFGGGLTPFQVAQLEQQAARGADQQLADIFTENVSRTEDKERAALAALQDIGSQDEARRLALTEGLTNLLSAERGQFDASGLAVKGGKSPGLFHGIF